MAERGMRLSHEQVLQTAIDRLTGGFLDRPDTPDGCVTAVQHLPANEGQFAPFPAEVDERLQEVLVARGVRQLYTHQATAIEHALARRHVVVTTPTASGKTLCYNAP